MRRTEGFIHPFIHAKMKSILAPVTLSTIRNKVFGGLFGWQSCPTSTMRSSKYNTTPFQVSRKDLTNVFLRLALGLCYSFTNSFS